MIFPYVGADDHTSRDLIVGSRDAADGRWVLLIHRIPPKPDYLRVKIGRRLARVGARWVDCGEELAVRVAGFWAGPRRFPVDSCGNRRREWASILLSRGLHRPAHQRGDPPLLRRGTRDLEDVTLSARALLEVVDSPGHDRSASERVQNNLARSRRRMPAAVRLDFFDASERRAADEVLEGLVGATPPIPRTRSPVAGETTSDDERTGRRRARCGPPFARRTAALVPPARCYRL